MSLATAEKSVAITTDKRDAEVIIVGAGAVGLLTALKLGRAGVDTIVLESHSDILQAPRAIAYMPVVSNELIKLGVFDDLRAIGTINTTGVTWRQPDGKPLATLPMITDPGIVTLTLGQDKLATVILDTLRRECPSVRVIFSQRVAGIELGAGKVTLMTSNNHNFEDYFFTSKFVVGCDGANSAVRRACMIPFEGFTWTNYRFTAADVEYDFTEHCSFPEANFVVDPENWAVIAKTGKENVWRVCYGERPELSPDHASVVERSKTRISAYIKPANKDGVMDYKLRRISPYFAHQRCAATYRKGNVLLAGDAAHSNNPVGGLGLTGGLLDAVVVGNVLVRHLTKGEPDELVTKAMEARRNIWVNLTNPVSQANFKRLHATDSAVESERLGFFERLNGKDNLAFVKTLGGFANLLPDTFES